MHFRAKQQVSIETYCEGRAHRGARYFRPSAPGDRLHMVRNRIGTVGRRQPSSPPPTVFQTNRNLPFAGETAWTSADGEQVTSRIAVHAVRRAAGMSILDWSITRLSAPDLGTGDTLPPGFELGLARGNLGNGISIVLIDGSHQRAYRR